MQRRLISWSLCALALPSAGASCLAETGGHRCAAAATSEHLAAVTPPADDPVLHGVMVPHDQLVPSFIDERLFRSLGPAQQRLLRWIDDRAAEDAAAGEPGLAFCLSPDATQAEQEAFEIALQHLQPELRYQLSNRWNGTALDPQGGGQGNPTTLTYSFAPDGTVIPSSTSLGEPAVGSDLFATLNGIYGSPAAWQPLFHQVFQRWGEVSGVTYIYEPSDDGAMFSSSNIGVSGVRGDIRIGGKPVDTDPDTGRNGSILAYNYFAPYGEMVIDTEDSNFTFTGNNSILLRNTVCHEHGHGLGFQHVCPVNGTKLMEPTLSTTFDGPRHDDIRAVQRQYGDPYEPDNSAAQATSIGELPLGTTTLGPVGGATVVNGSLLSIDADGEQDWFKFTTAGPRRISVTVTPIGTSYDNAQQSGSSCPTGNAVNSLSIADLNFQIVNSNGVSVLATVAAKPAGNAESISGFTLAAAGTYYVRVYEGNAPGESQLYHLSIDTQILAGAPLTIDVPAPPTAAEPNEESTVTAIIDLGGDTLVSGSPRLYYRAGHSGAYTFVPMLKVGQNYQAGLPAFSCEDTPQFYVQAQGTQTGVVTDPAQGGTVPFNLVVGTPVTVADFNFQTTTGWTVATTATDGQWEAGVPVVCGSVANNRGAPTADYDGSGSCFLTDNSTASSCNSDVDDGNTILTSPAFDITGVSDLTLSYARWYSNKEGSSPYSNVFTVEISTNNGGTWTGLETVGPSLTSPNPQVEGGWVYKQFNLSSLVTPTATFRVRFIASDVVPAIIEAGVDAFSIVGRRCSDAVVHCPADYNGVNGVTVQDIFDFLTAWLAGDELADFNHVNGVTVQDIFDFLTIWLAGC